MKEFAQRREKILTHMPDNSLALLTAGPLLHRNSDVEYAFRQDSHFYYLTGLEESFAIALLVKKQKQGRFILFCQDQDPQQAQWTGPRMGIQAARTTLGADESYSIVEVGVRIFDFLQGVHTIFYPFHLHPAFDKKLFEWLGVVKKKARSMLSAPHHLVDLNPILNEMRLIKSPEEMNLIKQACDITVEAHVNVMEQCRVGMHEYNLEAILLHTFCKRGGRHQAYPAIVASGDHACILHYTKNNAPLKDKELVLVDAGVEYGYYASDVTRTFPINGKFSAEQQALYEIVLAAQTEAIASIEPGVAWDSIQQKIIKVLVSGLVDLKILRGDVATLIEEKAYQPFYMHNSGHWMGLDVHDVGEYRKGGKSRILAPGMVFTVEPGLYVPSDLKLVPEPYRGIGIRIEDDILVTEKGYENLTPVPKAVKEIEKLMHARSTTK